MNTRQQLVGALVAFLLSAGAAAASPQQEKPISIDIASQPIEEALNEFGRQVNLHVVLYSDVARGVNSRPVSGMLTPQEALEKLLKDSGLRYEYLDARTVAIMPRAAVRAEKPTAGNAIEQELRLARASASGQSDDQSPPADRKNEPQSENLEEILVTAQKRTERLQEVPVAVTAVNAGTLIENNLVRVQDYAITVPGFSVSPTPSAGGGGQQALAIRGITTGFNNTPTVGITIDDVPFGSSLAIAGAGGGVIPDLDPSDLARVEILRGPQGTLYGASSMGGLLKFVTADPSTEGVSGRIQAGVSNINTGDGLGYSVRGSVNVPVGDTFAFRASGFTREEPGYIDNPLHGLEDINGGRVDGGRLSALWQPSDAFSLKLSALYQKTKGDGMGDVTSVGRSDELLQEYAFGIGDFEREVQAYSVTATAKLGRAELTSISGYNVNRFEDEIDFTYLLGGAANAFFGEDASPVFSYGKTNKFSQELRLTTPLGQRVEWLAGLFYTRESGPYRQAAVATDAFTGQLAGVLLAIDGNQPGSVYSEYAVFTDVTVSITDRFDVQLGGRQSEIRQYTAGVTQTGALFGTSSLVTQGRHTNANAFTYLLTPRFKITPAMMLYGRFASGYRAGGANLNPDPAVPRTYEPDKTKNYEVGFKGDLLDRALTFDASVYRIDWSGLQLNILNLANTQTYTANTSGAKSEGIDLTVEARPLAGLRIAAWAAWNNATLTEDIPASPSVFGLSGDRLPYSSRFSASLSIDQDFPLTGTVMGFVGATATYIGDRLGTLTSDSIRSTYPAYTRTDLRAGVRYDTWRANLYVNNLTDRRNVVGGGLGAYPPFAFIYMQPRVVGLSISKSF